MARGAGRCGAPHGCARVRALHLRRTSDCVCSTKQAHNIDNIDSRGRRFPCEQAQPERWCRCAVRGQRELRGRRLRVAGVPPGSRAGRPPSRSCVFDPGSCELYDLKINVDF